VFGGWPGRNLATMALLVVSIVLAVAAVQVSWTVGVLVIAVGLVGTRVVAELVVAPSRLEPSTDERGQVAEMLALVDEVTTPSWMRRTWMARAWASRSRSLERRSQRRATAERRAGEDDAGEADDAVRKLIIPD
jgi:hypothetical protein